MFECGCRPKSICLICHFAFKVIVTVSGCGGSSCGGYGVVVLVASSSRAVVAEQ